VLPHRGTPTRKLLERMFASRGIAPPRAAVETSDLSMVRGMLLTSDLVTAISPQQFDHELQTGVLAVLAIPLPETSRTIGITHRADAHPSTAATVLMSELRNVAGEFAKSAGAASRLETDEG
jgi:LysR family transcriptional regulator of gallate degradation